MLGEYKFKEKEEFWKRQWEENGVYKFDEDSTDPIYSVDTPPPYVTAAHLHAGHILSYSQAEFIVRYKRMKGYNVLYPMGFDDNGYPTENYVEKKYKIDKDKIERKEFVDLCLKETEIGIENYRNLWSNLGISVDWSKTYSTINPLCQKVSQKSFVDLYNKNKIYRKNEPMLWCMSCQTALAQADLEDEEVDSHLNYINFSIDKKIYSIATTRPELLPACVAIFANPEDERYKHLNGKKATIPLFDYEVPVYFDSAVIPSFGTGLMMVCTWGDIEDVKKVKTLNLEPRLIIEKFGKLNLLAGKYQGQTLKEARKNILDDLTDRQLLTKQDNIKHVVNIHERCNTPVEFMPTSQWFIDVLNIKDELIQKGRELHWYPEYMRTRYEEWVNGVKWDWCISRQRYYGVPFPLWFCKQCGEVIVADESELPVDPTEKQPKLTQCKKCSSTEFLPSTDVMDTWATSSCSPFIIPELVKNIKLKKDIFPNSLRPQGFEIIRTWIFYSIVKSFYHFNNIPFKDVMISGHGLDEQGRKISKRLGNFIEPEKLLSEFGADAIRYWATGATLGSNHKFDPNDVKKGKYTVNKLWNASKFCATYLDSYSPKEMPILEPEDKWILQKLNETIKASTDSFESYEYANVRTLLDKFFWGTFCDNYLEIIKHRATDESACYTMYHCLKNILKMYAPILPFVTEEIYEQMFKKHEQTQSIHKSAWPTIENDWIAESDTIKQTEIFIEEITMIRKEKAEKGLKYKDPLENYNPKTAIDLNIYGEKLKRIFNITNFLQG